jgi:phosphogluconate dehydratase
MSGASGKVLAAIQVTPEAVDGGVIARIRDGDLISIDAEQGTFAVTADDDVEQRQAETPDLSAKHIGMGRDLFTAFRTSVSGAEDGASIF